MTGNLDALDTGFRPALRRMLADRRLRDYAAPVDWDLELAATMKRLDGGPALLFSAVRGYDMPVNRQPVGVPGELRGRFRR